MTPYLAATSVSVKRRMFIPRKGSHYEYEYVGKSTLPEETQIPLRGFFRQFSLVERDSAAIDSGVPGELSCGGSQLFECDLAVQEKNH